MPRQWRGRDRQHEQNQTTYTGFHRERGGDRLADMGIP